MVYVENTFPIVFGSLARAPENGFHETYFIDF
jgi:hypothetical protein